jgi:hypothetical protein
VNKNQGEGVGRSKPPQPFLTIQISSAIAVSHSSAWLPLLKHKKNTFAKYSQQKMNERTNSIRTWAWSFQCVSVIRTRCTLPSIFHISFCENTFLRKNIYIRVRRWTRRVTVFIANSSRRVVFRIYFASFTFSLLRNPLNAAGFFLLLSFPFASPLSSLFHSHVEIFRCLVPFVL